MACGLVFANPGPRVWKLPSFFKAIQFEVQQNKDGRIIGGGVQPRSESRFCHLLAASYQTSHFSTCKPQVTSSVKWG